MHGQTHLVLERRTRMGAAAVDDAPLEAEGPPLSEMGVFMDTDMAALLDGVLSTPPADAPAEPMMRGELPMILLCLLADPAPPPPPCMRLPLCGDMAHPLRVPNGEEGPPCMLKAEYLKNNGMTNRSHTFSLGVEMLKPSALVRVGVVWPTLQFQVSTVVRSSCSSCLHPHHCCATRHQD